MNAALRHPLRRTSLALLAWLSRSFPLYEALCLALALLSPASARAQDSLVVHLDRPTVHISPMLYGLMTEEINRSYDGGLYAELIRNRSFLDSDKAPVSWMPVGPSSTGSSADAVQLTLDHADGPSPAQPVSLKLQVASATAAAPAGVANEGYWGMPVLPRTRYGAAVYARGAPGFNGPLLLALQSADGRVTYASARLDHLSPYWKLYHAQLTTGDVAPTDQARFAIELQRPGTINLGLVSLFPPTYRNTPNGNRRDLMRILADMHPAFLRFPGGNYLEGQTIAQRFDWQKTIGPLIDRPGHESPWGYRSSDGMGLLEFLEWCEDLHMQPLLAVYAGYSLDGEHVDPGPALEPYVRSALDEIQYATGSEDTRWGDERAKDGHPAPFHVTYVEIGNEDWFDRSGSYDGRFAQFYRAIKRAYPELQVIATRPVRSVTPDLVDDHYYRSAAAMERDWGHYDHYSRTGPKIMVGEWASTEGRPTPDMNAALGDAAWLMGLERDSDLVVLSAYAPLLVNVRAVQWGTNLIGYNAFMAFGSPSYYVQQMFSRNRGAVVLDSALTPASGTDSNLPRGVQPLYTEASRMADGTLVIKVVNVTASPRTLEIRLEGAGRPASRAALIQLSGQPSDQNSIQHPDLVAPRASVVTGISTDFTQQFPSYSVSLLRVRMAR